MDFIMTCRKRVHCQNVFLVLFFSITVLQQFIFIYYYHLKKGCGFSEV
jgi:hypothetical protein